MNATLEETKDLTPYQFPAGNERCYGEPEEGQTAWFEIGYGLGREQRTFKAGAWIPDSEEIYTGL